MLAAPLAFVGNSLSTARSPLPPLSQETTGVIPEQGLIDQGEVLVPNSGAQPAPAKTSKGAPGKPAAKRPKLRNESSNNSPARSPQPSASNQEKTGKRSKRSKRKDKKDKNEKSRQLQGGPEPDRSFIGKLADTFVPGSSAHLPDWAKPIVAHVQGEAVEGSTVEAFMAVDGTLVVHGTLDAHADSSDLAIRAAHATGGESNGIEVLLTVEDPTTANQLNPAKVEVVAAALEAEEPVTTTAEVFQTSKVGDVASETVDKSVEQASDVLPEAV
ncbi:hypothetical protein ABWK57_13855 [Streptomyces sp. NPDC094045]|uniref:hypothetical protein n=1 Tax=Streptomyces sp. NPDC094045 TaxID=3161019 RepID=UPI003398F4D2